MTPVTAPRIVALIAAYNEADVLPSVVADLAAQGIGVYLIDNRSTDGTVEAVSDWLGRGLLGVETFPPESEPEAGYPWRRILERKEQLAAELDADWFIHHDADEFRESPWPGVGLAAGIALVDRLGYNAVDFAVLNFWPSDDSFAPGDDPRERLRGFLPGDAWDAVQIKCWRRPEAGGVDLASTGGHDAQFAGRRVFPIRFVLRHYPVRGQRHGERKIHRERRPRFLPEERAAGWHVQYDSVPESFLRPPESLRAYDAAAVGVELQIRNRELEGAERELAALRAAEQALRTAADEARERLAAADSELLLRRAETAALGETLRRLERDLAELGERRDALVAEAAARDRALTAEREARELAEARGASLDAELAGTRRMLAGLEAALREIESSRSWRATAPLRALARRLRRRP